jgi:polyribonucleotide nucleotidyltransferase
VKIDVMDDGKVHVFANNGKAADEALKMIRDVTATAEIGKTYLGKVVRIADFGAFVEIFPGTDGLLHISEIADTAHSRVRDELKEGDQVLVKVSPSRATRFASAAKQCCSRAGLQAKSAFSSAGY